MKIVDCNQYFTLNGEQLSLLKAEEIFNSGEADWSQKAYLAMSNFVMTKPILKKWRTENNLPEGGYVYFWKNAPFEWSKVLRETDNFEEGVIVYSENRILKVMGNSWN